MVGTIPPYMYVLGVSVTNVVIWNYFGKDRRQFLKKIFVFKLESSGSLNISISGQTSVEPILIMILRMDIGIGISLHPYIGIGISSYIYRRECAHIT